MSGVVLAAALCAIVPGAGIAQEQGTPPEYLRALALLEEGDTAAAVDLLRAVNQAAPRFGPAFVRLGAVLTARASELERDFADRIEAERALRRALDLLGPDPEIMMEYGFLLIKQRIRVDALQALENSLRAADRGSASFPPEQLARVHLGMGRVHETWYEEQQNRAVPGREFLTDEDAEALAMRPSTRVLASYENMLEQFRLALFHDPGQVEAGVRLLSHLADAEEWYEYHDLAKQLTLAAPYDARAFLFRGLGLHHVGRSDLAAAAFDTALQLMPAEQRERYTNIAPLLKPEARALYTGLGEEGRREMERIFFIITDPLYLTAAEERRLEHYSRAALADLKFGSPGTGGIESERGEILLRYGRPDMWEQRVNESDGRVAVTWSYRLDDVAGQADWRRLRFGFSRQQTYRAAQLTEWSRQLADDLVDLMPEWYRPATVTRVMPVPHQRVRFRGSQPHLTVMEFYGRLVPPYLEVEPGHDIEAGFFLFDRTFHTVWSDAQHVAIMDTVLGVTYRVEVEPGLYYYSLEGRAGGPDSLPRPLARTRLSLSAEGFPADQVSISDLLLADEIIPRVTMVNRRDELVIVPSRTLVFEPGQPVNIYFEVYGLAADPTGYARFRAELLIGDSAGPNVVERLARGAQEIFRLDFQRDTRLSWERTVPLDSADDRVPEYLKMELPRLSRGVYRIQIKVTDLVSGETVETSRHFGVDEPRRLPETFPADTGGFEMQPTDPARARSLLDRLLRRQRPPPDTLVLPPDTAVPPPDTLVPPPDTAAIQPGWSVFLRESLEPPADGVPIQPASLASRRDTGARAVVAAEALPPQRLAARETADSGSPYVPGNARPVRFGRRRGGRAG